MKSKYKNKNVPNTVQAGADNAQTQMERIQMFCQKNGRNVQEYLDTYGMDGNGPAED